MNISVNLSILIGICIFLTSCCDKSSIDFFNSGLECYNNKDFICANKKFSEAVKKDASNTSYLIFLANSNKELGRKEEALKGIFKILSMDSTNYEAYLLRAKIKLEYGDFKSALTDCITSLTFKKDNADAYSVKGSIYEKMSDYSNAINSYKETLKYSNDCNVYLNIGALSRKLGNEGEAYTYLSKAGELGCTDAYKFINQKTEIVIKSDIEKPIQYIETSEDVYRNKEFYEIKGYQVFSEYNVAVKCPCVLKDGSQETSQNHNFNFGCVENEHLKSESIFYQLIINKFPDGYKDLSDDKKKETWFKLRDGLKKAGSSQDVVFKNTDAVVINYKHNGLDGRSILFVRGNYNYAFNVITNNQIDSKFNYLTNNIEFLD
jgi:tetratricopeptide (TPR) repeat protein